MAKLSVRSSSNNDKKGKKKKKSSGPKALTMKVSAPKANPFESIWSHRKFDVLGKKRKGEERRIGLARSLAIEKVVSLGNSCELIYWASFHVWSFFFSLGEVEEKDAIEGVRTKSEVYGIFW